MPGTPEITYVPIEIIKKEFLDFLAPRQELYTKLEETNKARIDTLYASMNKALGKILCDEAFITYLDIKYGGAQALLLNLQKQEGVREQAHKLYDPKHKDAGTFNAYLAGSITILENAHILFPEVKVALLNCFGFTIDEYGLPVPHPHVKSIPNIELILKHLCITLVSIAESTQEKSYREQIAHAIASHATS